MGKFNKKQIRKKIDKNCFFCGCQDYDLLDAHRIIYGSDGGKYKDFNILTVCSNCHRKIHSNKIKILGKHFSTSGKYIINYIDEEGNEQWK